MARRQKLNYRFHNPNTPEDTAEFVFKVFLAANKRKLDRAIEEAAEQSRSDANNEQSISYLAKEAVS